MTLHNLTTRRQFIRGAFLTVGGLVAGPLLLTACGGDDDSGAPQGSVGTPAVRRSDKPLRILISFTYLAVDPSRGANWLGEWGAAETLTWADNDIKLQGQLAESWQNIDPTTWRFKLRPNVTFQNGKPMNAAAVVAALERQAKTHATAKELLGTANFAATGELELTVKTQAPDAVVPYKLADLRGFPIYDVATVEAEAGEDARLAGKGIFTGPYSLVSFSKERMELVANEAYWGGTPALPKIIATSVADPQGRLAAIQNGEADISFYPLTDTAAVLKGRTDAYFVKTPMASAAMQLVMAHFTQPFDDAQVRRALGMSIDYKEIAEKVMAGVYDVAEGLYPKRFGSAVLNQKTDVEGARNLLTRAGWISGSDGVRVKDGKRLEMTLLSYPQQPDTGAAAIAVQSHAKRTGFDVKLVNAEDITGALNKKDGSWHAALVFNSTMSTYSGDPYFSLVRYLGTGAPSNYGGVANPKLDGMLAEVVQTLDTKRQNEMLQQVQKLIVEEEGHLFIAGFKSFPAIVTPEWKNYVPQQFYRFVSHDTAPSA